MKQRFIKTSINNFCSISRSLFLSLNVWTGEGDGRGSRQTTRSRIFQRSASEGRSRKYWSPLEIDQLANGQRRSGHYRNVEPEVVLCSSNSSYPLAQAAKNFVVQHFCIFFSLLLFIDFTLQSTPTQVISLIYR